MMDYIKDPDTWLSLFAVVISMIALWQTHRQIKLSNKQQLFDRRLSDYLLLKDLAETYRKGHAEYHLTDNERFTFRAPMVLMYLTAIPFFDDALDIWNEPDNYPLQKQLLSKRSELRKAAEEISIIFDQTSAAPASAFILAYEKAIEHLHEFIWMWSNTEQKYPNGMNQELLQAREADLEELKAIMNCLDESFLSLETKKTEQEMKRQIKL